MQVGGVFCVFFGFRLQSSAFGCLSYWVRVPGEQYSVFSEVVFRVRVPDLCPCWVRLIGQP